LTIDSLIAELSKFPKDYEVTFVAGGDKIAEREIQIIIAHKEKFIIIKYKSIW